MKESEINGELVTLTPALPQEFTEQSLIAVFNQVAAEVRCEIPNIETQSGRKSVKDLAAKVSKAKKAVDAPLRNYLRELKTLPKIVERNARESLERFECLQAEILQPLELARAEQDKNLEIMQLMVNHAATSTIEDLQDDLVILEGIEINSFWPELVKKAKLAKETADNAVRINLDRLKKEAELEQLRKEKEEADRKLLQEKIEREAQEKAQKDALQALANAERAKQEAERKAEMQAEQARLDAIRQSEIAEQQARQREAQAAEAERKRIADEEARKAAADKAREQDIAHRTSVNRETLAEMIGLGIEEETAKKVITMVAKGQLRHVKIHY